MNRLQTLPVVVGLAGFVILYGAITNRNPIDVVKLTLTGGDLSKAAPIYTPSGSATPPGAVDGRTLPGTPQADGDARTDPPGFNPDTDDVLPRLPGEGVPRGTPVALYYPTRKPFASSQYWV